MQIIYKKNWVIEGTDTLVLCCKIKTCQIGKYNPKVYFAINNSCLFRELKHSYLWPNFTESKIRLQNVQPLNIMFGEWLTNKFWHLLEQIVCCFSHFWAWIKVKIGPENTFEIWIHVYGSLLESLTIKTSWASSLEYWKADLRGSPI